MKSLKLTAPLIFFLATSGVSWSVECGTPEKVARLFLQYDLEGSRLASDISARIDELEADDMHEPGWDASTLTTGYEIKSVKEDGIESTVSVHFSRAWETEEEFERKKIKDQTEELHLRKVDGCWKIAPPIYNPHVSVAVLLKHFRSLEGDASMHSNSQAEKEYLSWVRHQIGNFEAYRATVSQ